MICWASSMVIMGLGHHQLLASTNMLLCAESIFLSDSSGCCAESFCDSRERVPALNFIQLASYLDLGSSLRRFAPWARCTTDGDLDRPADFEADSLTAVDRTNGAHFNLVTAGQLTQSVTLDHLMSLYLVLRLR